MVVSDRPLVHTLRVAARPHYLTAVTVSRGTASAESVQHSSLPTHASKDSLFCQRVKTRTSSSVSDLKISMETNLGERLHVAAALDEALHDSVGRPFLDREAVDYSYHRATTMPLPPTRLAILSAFSVSAMSSPGLAPCIGYSATPTSTSKSAGSLARNVRTCSATR